MEDVIQVLIFVVTFIIFIVSAVRKQKKKPNAKSSSFNGLIESVLGVPEEIRQPQQNIDYDSFQNDTFIDTDTKSNETLVDEGIDAIPDNNVDDIVDIETEDVSPESTFDLRSAVIYSEILNRKTF